MLNAGGGQSLRQAVDLDVVGFEAALIAHGRIAGHEGETLDRALQWNLPFWNLERERDVTHRP
jgi:hypothetical protein